MVRNPSSDPESIVSQNPDYQPVSDIGLIESLVDQVIGENAKHSPIIGRVMKKHSHFWSGR